MSLMRDVQDTEDYSQFRRYLIFRGRTAYQAAEYTEAIRYSLKKRERRFSKIGKELYERELNRGQGFLSSILFPESQELQGTNPYHRYIAYLLTFDNRIAAKQLGICRDTLHKWLKRNGYQLKKPYLKQSTVWHDPLQRKRFAPKKAETL